MNKNNTKNCSFYLSLHVLVAFDRILTSCKTYWGMTLTCTVFACEKEQAVSHGLLNFMNNIHIETLYSKVYIQTPRHTRLDRQNGGDDI